MTEYGDPRYRCTPRDGKPHSLAAVGFLTVIRRGWFLPWRAHIYDEWRPDYESARSGGSFLNTGQATAYDPDLSQEGRHPAIVTGAVHRDELPILLVLHEEDGAWQFLDGGTVSDDALVLHVSHVFDKHPDLLHLTDLPEGWAAERDSETDEWRRYPWQAE